MRHGREGLGVLGRQNRRDRVAAGNGSTKQADAIAEADERAGIKCYLINGVCHQAANRILFPAGITARGARGYDVSEALFGTYGRPRGPFGTCPSPFNQHAGVTGDLPECVETRAMRQQVTRKARVLSPEAGKQERKYIKGVLAIYGAGVKRTFSSTKGLRGPGPGGFSSQALHVQGAFQPGVQAG